MLYPLIILLGLWGFVAAMNYKVNDARIQLINMSNNLNQFAYDKIN